MTWQETKQCIRADLWRYGREAGWNAWVQAFRFEPGFRLTLLMRLCRFTRGKGWLRWTAYPFLRFWFNRLSMKLHTFMDPLAEIGPGLNIGHPFVIILNHRVVIGCNCTIAHQVTLGSRARGDKRGCPVIGDRVYIGPGAKVFGNITIGNDAAIGANAVVTADVPAGGVVAGVPAKLISMKGSEGYVTDIAPDPKESR